MKKIKTIICVFLMGTINVVFASDNALVDANPTRESIGFEGSTLMPILILAIFFVLLYFATQKIPGLKS
jgi:hypothetical protein